MMQKLFRRAAFGALALGLLASLTFNAAPQAQADGGRILRDAGAGAAVGAGVGLITGRPILRTTVGGAAVGAGIGIFRTGPGTRYDYGQYNRHGYGNVRNDWDRWDRGRHHRGHGRGRGRGRGVDWGW